MKINSNNCEVDWGWFRVSMNFWSPTSRSNTQEIYLAEHCLEMFHDLDAYLCRLDIVPMPKKGEHQSEFAIFSFCAKFYFLREFFKNFAFLWK